jgi:hypothetical protein
MSISPEKSLQFMSNGNIVPDIRIVARDHRRIIAVVAKAQHKDGRAGIGKSDRESETESAVPAGKVRWRTITL